MVAMPGDISVRVRQLELSSQSNRDSIVAHEKLCTERYGNINESVSSIKGILKWYLGVTTTGMAGILVKLLFFPGGS